MFEGFVGAVSSSGRMAFGAVTSAVTSAVCTGLEYERLKWMKEPVQSGDWQALYDQLSSYGYDVDLLSSVKLSHKDMETLDATPGQSRGPQNDFWALLHYAAHYGKTNILEHCVRQVGIRALTCLTRELENSLLHLAVLKGYVEVANFLMLHTSELVNSVNTQQCKPLHYAGNPDMVDVLLKRRSPGFKSIRVAVVDFMVNGRFSPVDAACERGYKSVAQRLIDAGAGGPTSTYPNSRELHEYKHSVRLHDKQLWCAVLAAAADDPQRWPGVVELVVGRGHTPLLLRDGGIDDEVIRQLVNQQPDGLNIRNLLGRAAEITFLALGPPAMRQSSRAVAIPMLSCLPTSFPADFPLNDPLAIAIGIATTNPGASPLPLLDPTGLCGHLGCTTPMDDGPSMSNQAQPIQWGGDWASLRLVERLEEAFQWASTHLQVVDPEAAKLLPDLSAVWRAPPLSNGHSHHPPLPVPTQLAAPNIIPIAIETTPTITTTTTTTTFHNVRHPTLGRSRNSLTPASDDDDFVNQSTPFRVASPALPLPAASDTVQSPYYNVPEPVPTYTPPTSQLAVSAADPPNGENGYHHDAEPVDQFVRPSSQELPTSDINLDGWATSIEISPGTSPTSATSLSLAD